MGGKSSFYFETHAAKEARRSVISVRKTPRLFPFREAGWGLQCGLSGNPVLLLVTKQKKA